MTNYIEKIMTVDMFAAEASTKLKEKALAAKDYLKGRYENVNDNDFVVIEVEGYNCIGKWANIWTKKMTFQMTFFRFRFASGDK